MLDVKPRPWAETRGAVLYRDGYRCQICKAAPATEVDHIWPRSAGGTDELDNLQAACKSCNAKKGDSLYYANFTPQRIFDTVNLRFEQAVAAVIEVAKWHGVYETLCAEGPDGLTGAELAEAAWIENKCGPHRFRLLILEAISREWAA